MSAPNNVTITEPLTPREILKILKGRMQGEGPMPTIRRLLARGQQDARVYHDVVEGRQPEIYVSVERRIEILKKEFASLLVEIEGSADSIKFAEDALAHPKKYDLVCSPQDLERQLSDSTARLAQTRVEAVRVTHLIMDTLEGKFGD